mgnify:CR=1 FL=1
MASVNNNGPNFQLTIKPSPMTAWLPCALYGLTSILVVFGPFLVLAKVAFMAIWLLLSFYYWRKLNATKHYSQLRLESGHLILGFSNGLEPELIHLIGRQRVLPWLVELNIMRENGKQYCWGIAIDAISRDEFRRLKVFVKTQCES